MIRARKTGQWAKAQRILRGVMRVRRAIKLAILQEAHFLRAKMITGITGQAGFAAHAPATPLIRQGAGFGGGKIMIVSGTTLGSIVVHRQGSTVFVGVKRGRTHASGRDVVDVAAIHEFGKDYRPSKAQLRYIHTMIRKSGGYDAGKVGAGAVQIRIPRRPFVEPVEKKYGRPMAMVRRLRRRFAVLMRGDLGTA